MPTTVPRRISREEGRRLAILGQGLSGHPKHRPSTPVEVVEWLGKVQVDPTKVVERAEQLQLWSRIGSFDREELRRALEEPPRQLFEYVGFLLPLADLPLHRPVMRRYPRPIYTRGGYVAHWLADNGAFRQYVLDEIRRRGPLMTRDLDDRADVPWQTGGWNDGKNVGRMLEILWRKGDLTVARREGTQRVWDLFERVFPGAHAEPIEEGMLSEDELPDEIVAVETMERQLRTAGFVKPGWGSALDYELPARDIGEDSLRTDGIAVPVTIDELPGDWLAHRDLLAALDQDEWRPRTTLLGPFDPLITDRERTEALFDFRFHLEIYKPAAQREWGYYVLPMLDGDRLIGRIDPALDRKKRTLRINAVFAEPDAPEDPESLKRVAAALRELATWLGANLIAMPSVLPPAFAPLAELDGAALDSEAQPSVNIRRP
jgi:uncharacterized protein YcaQ